MIILITIILFTINISPASRTEIVNLLSTFVFSGTWLLFYDFRDKEHLLDVKWMRINVYSTAIKREEINIFNIYNYI